MEFDTKQKVLLAIYLEYQKDIPDMSSIKAETVGVDREVFDIALDKLDNEQLVKGIRFSRGSQNEVLMAFIDTAKMTTKGLQYVETKLDIQPEKTGLEKVKEVSQKAATWGWNEAKDFAAKVLSELIQSQA